MVCLVENPRLAWLFNAKDLIIKILLEFFRSAARMRYIFDGIFFRTLDAAAGVSFHEWQIQGAVEHGVLHEIAHDRLGHFVEIVGGVEVAQL